MAALPSLAGVGAATATRMVDAGMENSASVVVAGVDGLSKAGLNAKAAATVFASAEAAEAAIAAAMAVLTSLSGVGPKTAVQMVAAGIDSPAAILTAGRSGLAEAGLGTAAVNSAFGAATAAKKKAAAAARKARKAATAVKLPPTAQRQKPGSVISDEEAGVRGDQVGSKIAAPKGVADMLRRIKDNR